MRDREIVQSNYGRADALHRAARAFLIEAMAGLSDALAENGSRLIKPVRCSGRPARMPPKARCGSPICSPLKQGAAAIFETSPIQRYVRDIHAAVRHIAMSPNNYIVSGRVGLGLDPGTPRF